jgi:hypothetical protein
VASYSLTKTFHQIIFGSDSKYQFEIADMAGSSFVNSKNYVEESLEYHDNVGDVLMNDELTAVSSNIPSVGRYVENQNSFSF